MRGDVDVVLPPPPLLSHPHRHHHPHQHRHYPPPSTLLNHHNHHHDHHHHRHPPPPPPGMQGDVTPIHASLHLRSTPGSSNDPYTSHDNTRGPPTTHNDVTKDPGSDVTSRAPITTSKAVGSKSDRSLPPPPPATTTTTTTTAAVATAVDSNPARYAAVGSSVKMTKRSKGDKKEKRDKGGKKRVKVGGAAKLPPGGAGAAGRPLLGRRSRTFVVEPTHRRPPHPSSPSPLPLLPHKTTPAAHNSKAESSRSSRNQDQGSVSNQDRGRSVLNQDQGSVSNQDRGRTVLYQDQGSVSNQDRGRTVLNQDQGSVSTQDGGNVLNQYRGNVSSRDPTSGLPSSSSAAAATIPNAVTVSVTAAPRERDDRDERDGRDHRDESDEGSVFEGRDGGRSASDVGQADVAAMREGARNPVHNCGGGGGGGGGGVTLPPRPKSAGQIRYYDSDDSDDSSMDGEIEILDIDKELELDPELSPYLSEAPPLPRVSEAPPPSQGLAPGPAPAWRADSDLHSLSRLHSDPAAHSHRRRRNSHNPSSSSSRLDPHLHPHPHPHHQHHHQHQHLQPTSSWSSRRRHDSGESEVSAFSDTQVGALPTAGRRRRVMSEPEILRLDLPRRTLGQHAPPPAALPAPSSRGAPSRAARERLYSDTMDLMHSRYAHLALREDPAGRGKPSKQSRIPIRPPAGTASVSSMASGFGDGGGGHTPLNAAPPPPPPPPRKLKPIIKSRDDVTNSS